MRGYCWRVGSTVELGDKCPECGSLHDPIPDQTQCAAYVEMNGHDVWEKARGMPCTLPYGHAGKCTHGEQP